MHTLLVGLLLGKFLDTLYANPLSKMDELYNQVARHIIIEENSNTSKKATKVVSTSTLNTTQAFKRRGVSKYNNYISLNVSIDVIIYEMGGFHGKGRRNH